MGGPIARVAAPADLLVALVTQGLQPQAQVLIELVLNAAAPNHAFHACLKWIVTGTGLLQQRVLAPPLADGSEKHRGIIVEGPSQSAADRSNIIELAADK